MSAQIKRYEIHVDQYGDEFGRLDEAPAGFYMAYTDHLAAMAAASARSDKLAELLREALHEMCNTVAPRNSFTDTIDRIDAALSELPK